jgi:cell division transport system permease protein
MPEKQFKKRPKKKLGTYPAASVVFSISLALFIIGLFGVLLIHTNQLSRIIKQNLEVQVYLQKNVTGAQVTKIRKTLSSQRYILQTNGSPEVNFISKEDAAEEFKKVTGENFSEFLGDNPLRDMFRIKINTDYQYSDSLSKITKSIEAIGGVYEVAYVENLVDAINDNVTKISIVLLGFSALLILIVMLLINNTIKLALFSQRFLIRSMQLVGATKQFIQKPFLTRAVFYGLLSGFIAIVTLAGITHYAYLQIDELKILSDEKNTFILYGFIIVIGMLLALISTYKAISKYLKMSLDDLY